MRVTVGLVFLFIGMCLCHAEKADKTFLSYEDYPPLREDGWAYKKYIASFKAPPLRTEGKNSQEVYRLLYCDTWIPALLITIKKQGNAVTLESKQSGAMGGYIPTPSVFETKRKLTAKEWQKFQQLFEKSQFWTTPHYIKRMVLDGDDSILEVSVNGKYRYVFRDTPCGFPEDKPLADLFYWMIERVPQRGILETSSGGLAIKDSGIILDSGKPSTASSKGKR